MIVAANVIGALLLLTLILSIIPVRFEMLWTTEQPLRVWLQHPLVRIFALVRLPDELEHLEGYVLGVPARVFEKRIRAALEQSEEETRAPKEPEPEAETPEKEPGRPLAETLDEIVPKLEPLVGPVLSFAVELPKHVRIRSAELTITYGLGQPDFTGLATGMIMAGTAWWPPPLKVRALPQWHRMDADVQTYLFVSARPLSIFAAVILFGLRTVREWLDMRFRRVEPSTKVEANS